MLTYGAEAWTISESDERMLKSFKRKVYKVIFVICYNYELYSMFREATISHNALDV